MKHYKIELFLSAENESDLKERLEDIDKNDEFEDFGKIEEVTEEGKPLKENELFRVSYNQPSNLGYEKTYIKIFNDKEKALEDAQTLLKSFAEDCKDTDEDISINKECP